MNSEDLQTVRSLLAVLSGSGARELEFSSGPTRIRIVMQQGTTQVPHSAIPAEPADRPAPLAPAGARPDAPHDATTVVAPMHGTLHHAPNPESPPFVQPGAVVAAGQTLFIMEAMKVFTPVAAPCDGIVTAIHAGNGEDVAAGQSLATIGAAA